ncbi:MAG: glycosyltransferase family 2 protein [Nitrospira sp.]|nr:glycosyltransferase family 2 protein [Nitrospira sp.]
MERGSMQTGNETRNVSLMKLSVAIITKNEEKNLPDCLKSVSFADDIIVVVDSRSTDRTAEIAEKFGCRVFVEDWKGDGPQKNSAIDKCKYEWALILDADERIPDETKHEIIRVINNSDAADAYNFPRKNYFHGKWIKHCGWWPDTIIRLAKKSRGTFKSITHGKWATDGRVVTLNSPIEHFSFKTYSDMVRVMEGRSSEMAKEMHAAGRRATIITPFIHGIAMFVKIYLIRLGFLEGLDGFMISLTRAGGTFLKYAKLLELQREEKK